MAVLKYYDGDSWEPVVSALQGPTGAAGAIYQTTAPTDTGILWIDTDDDGELVIPNGGVTGSVLTKSSSADYDTEWNVPTSPGLVHIETQNIGAVAAVNFNNVFTSAYRNYRFVFEGQYGSQGHIDFRMRLSGTDASGTNYAFNSAGFSGAFGQQVSSSQTAGRITYYDSQNSQKNISGDIFAPALAQTTFLTVQGNQPTAAWVVANNHGVSTAYDGITFLTTAGSFTSGGKISIYGYRGV